MSNRQDRRQQARQSRNQQPKNKSSKANYVIVPPNFQTKTETPEKNSKGDKKLSYDNVIASWTRVIGLFTLVLAVATGYSAYVLETTDHTLKETLIASNRAWLAPILAELDGPLEKNQPIKVIVSFQNSGKDPAMNVKNVAEGGVTLSLTPQMAAYSQQFGPAPPVAEPCKGLTPQVGSPSVYPSTVQGIKALIAQSMIADDAIISGERTFFVHGCAAYESYGETRFSEYCFWLGPRIDPKTGRRIFQSCSGGHRAT